MTPTVKVITVKLKLMSEVVVEMTFKLAVERTSELLNFLPK
jgi:hypothetical protein